MPARRRRKNSSTSPKAAADGTLDPVSRFGLMLKEAQQREEAEAERERQRKRERRQRREAAAAEAATLENAKRDLEKAIAAVRRATRDRNGIDEAESAWRAAKARVLELETGQAPDWAPEPESVDGSAPDADAPPDDSASDGDADVPPDYSAPDADVPPDSAARDQS